jgi:hypothetical protein
MPLVYWTDSDGYVQSQWVDDLPMNLGGGDNPYPAARPGAPDPMFPGDAGATQSSYGNLSAPMNLGGGENIYPPASQETPNAAFKTMIDTLGSALGSFKGDAPAAQVGGSRGALPTGFGSWGEYDAWTQAFAQEHGGLTPAQYYKGDVGAAVQDRNDSQVWAQMHGNPTSWGNKPGDSTVPLTIFRRLNQAQRSPDFGPLDAEGHAQGADAIGGALMGPQAATPVAGQYSDKTKALLAALLMQLRNR